MNVLNRMASFTAALLLLLFLLPGPSEAQTPRDHAIHLGVSGGMNNPWIISQNNFGRRELDYEPLFRPGFGLHAGYQFLEGFGVFREGVGFRTGLLWTQLGQAYEAFEGENYRHLTYLQIPFLVNLRFGAVDQGFYLQTGPQLGLLQNADIAVFGNTRPSIENLETGQTAPRSGEEVFRDTELAWFLELGPYFSITERAYINIGLRSMISLQDINALPYRHSPEPADETYEPSRNAYIGVHVSLYYFFPLGI